MHALVYSTQCLPDYSKINKSILKVLILFGRVIKLKPCDPLKMREDVDDEISVVDLKATLFYVRPFYGTVSDKG